MRQFLVHLKLFFVAMIWGFGWPAGRIVALDVPPVLAAWIRYVIAVFCFILYIKISGKWHMPSKKQWKGLFQIGFFSTFLYQLFFMFGMGRTAAGDASLMITLNPLFTAVLASLFIHEAFTKRHALGVGFGFTGVAILFFASPNTDLDTSARWLGNAFIACAALSWATSSILMKKMMLGDDQEEGLSPLILTVWSSVTGLFFLSPFVAFETIQSGTFHSPSIDAWYGIVFLAIFSTVVSYVWYADGIIKIGAGKAALYVYLIPPFGILGGYILLDEQLGFSLLMSFLLIVSGVAIAQSEKHHEQEQVTLEHGN